MRILAISDIESNYIYNHFDKERFKDVSLVLAAGDLKASYLSFVATMLNVPVLYVHGNHDSRLIESPPDGCICIDGRIYIHEGIRILGFGGCMKYKGGPFQYTEREMALRIAKNRLKYIKGFDILLTHAPAFELGDGGDLAHTGFKAFTRLMDKYQPKLMVHGHQHLNYGLFERKIQYNSTTIINAFDYTIIDY